MSLSRQAYAEVLTYSDENDNGALHAADSAEVTVYIGGTSKLATIYDAREGGSAKSNPFIVGSTGLALFWAEKGDYDIEFHDTSLPARFGDYIVGWQSSPVNVEIEKSELSNSGDVEWEQEPSGAWLAKLKANSVAAAEIVDGSVGNSEIANGAVTATKLGNGSVGSTQLASASVGSAQLANSSKNLFPQLVGVSGTSTSRGTGSVRIGAFRQDSDLVDIYTGLASVTWFDATLEIASGYIIAFDCHIVEIVGQRVRIQFVGNTSVPAEIANLSFCWKAES